ncbi:MAG TPA: penicillin-insensitive murein endopeptidase [Bauldia sp.]|nr:penicillin-insensitive murein endopeptidase [Bauldia sp.]
MRAMWVTAVLGVALVAGGVAGAKDVAVTAKQLFGHVSTPSSGATRSIGFYAKGCLAGAVPLPLDGPNWQVMRLSRNRHWGTPELVTYLERFAADVSKDGWPGLLVGDMSQPRGGPMPTGHASHQIGLDADIWFTPMPDYTMSADEREKKGAVSLLMTGRLSVDPKKWSPLYGRLLKRAVSYPEVERIFVSPAIKKELCETVPPNDHAWLRKLRPWWGHDDHFHVRLTCPPGMAGCDGQDPPPVGDGCDASLDNWFKPPPPPPKTPVKPKPPPPELTLADLPKACASVLYDGTSRAAAEAATVPLPRLRPATAASADP